MPHQSKLTRPDVAWIKGVLLQDRRERVAAGMKSQTRGLMERLAKKFDVSVWTIQSIRKGKRRKNVQAHIWGDGPPLPRFIGIGRRKK